MITDEETLSAEEVDPLVSSADDLADIKEEIEKTTAVILEDNEFIKKELQQKQDQLLLKYNDVLDKLVEMTHPPEELLTCRSDEFLTSETDPLFGSFATSPLETLEEYNEGLLKSRKIISSFLKELEKINEDRNNIQAILDGLNLAEGSLKETQESSWLGREEAEDLGKKLPEWATLENPDMFSISLGSASGGEKSPVVDELSDFPALDEELQIYLDLLGLDSTE